MFLLDEETEDCVGQPYEHSGPCVLFLSGLGGGSTVTIEVAPTNEPDAFVPLSRVQMSHPQHETVNLPGRYWLRCRLRGATALTKVTVQTNQ